MDELIAFLAARLDEDQAVALAATPGSWRDEGGYVTDIGPDGLSLVQVTDYGTQDDYGNDSRPQGHADSAHIARHDPARVLREVEAKRRILAEHYPQDPCDAHDPSFNTIPCDTLLLLALPHSDHPDYKEDWRP
jgi:hypothetical protein